LMLDSDDVPHVSYYAIWDNSLRYAYKDGAGWHVENVDEEADGGKYSSLALDEDGQPHISYYEAKRRDLKYAYQDDTGWHIESVDVNGDVGVDSSLTLDKEGLPHISYCGTTKNRLKYAVWDGERWSIEFISSGEDVASSSSLELTKGGFPHITYYNVGNRDLMYFYKYYAEVVSIEETEIIEADVFPVEMGAPAPAQVLVYVKGVLPDSCSEYNDIVSVRAGNNIQVSVTIKRFDKDNCIDTPDDYFQRNINLGGDFNFGETYYITINGKEYVYVCRTL